MRFRDRTQAGELLAVQLLKFKGEDVVVFALPRGGVPVAAPIAAALEAPLDLVLVRKIGLPIQPELAIGAIVDGNEPLTVRNQELIDAARVSDEEFELIRERQLREIERRRGLYIGRRPRPPLRGRIAIVVDDGVATGATTRAALRALRARDPSRLVLAVPVAPPSALESLAAEVDEIVCLEKQEDFGAIGCFYDDFDQLSDDDVIAALARFDAEQNDAR